MTDALKPSAQKVQEALNRFGLDFEVKSFAESTRTAAEAAAAIGCEVSQIAKSLVFHARESDRPILVIASGTNRVDESRVEQILGEPVGRANADFVRSRTGFAIGGVPPLGHDEPLETLIDRDLLAFEEIWAAAGTPNTVFRLRPGDLERITGGRLADLKQP